jgi:hypothetical protein
MSTDKLKTHIHTTESKGNLIDFLNTFELKHKSFINLILRPLFMLLVFLSVGYYTMWLSATYVKQEDFKVFLEKQFANDAKQDELAKNRFDVVQSKLDALITQQTSYTEQLKAYNQLISHVQKQVDSIDQRVLYLERRP